MAGLAQGWPSCRSRNGPRARDNPKEAKRLHASYTHWLEFWEWLTLGSMTFLGCWLVVTFYYIEGPNSNILLPRISGLITGQLILGSMTFPRCWLVVTFYYIEGPNSNNLLHMI